MKKLKFLLTVGLIPLYILINYITPENLFIEKYYSNQFYPFISEKLRFLTGHINIPLGDVFYLVLVIVVFYLIIFRGKSVKVKVLNLGSLLFILTFIFYIFWGLNYKRITIKNHLGVENRFEKKELLKFTEELIDKINKNHISLFLADSIKPENPYSFDENIIKSHENAEKLKTIFKDDIGIYNYKRKSVKKSLFSFPLTFMGFSGYINPFTNEANINYKIPPTSLTFVINHEIAHQLGIASEKDANFISYIMLINSKDKYHNFCAMSYALRLCLNEISKIDHNNYKILIKRVNKGIIKDYIEINKFWEKFEGKIENISKKTYDIYLKQNNIKSGIKNYNESISLILNYNKLIND